jgi:hypothetical protein
VYPWHMEKTPVYVLVTLSIGTSGEVTRKNVGVTFNIHDAEKHVAADFSNEYETLSYEGDIQLDAETSALTAVMRDFRGLVAEMQAESLR